MLLIARHHAVKSSPPSSSSSLASSLAYFTATFKKERVVSMPANAVPGRKLMRAFLMSESD